jgi:hypothetical protein
MTDGSRYLKLILHLLAAITSAKACKVQYILDTGSTKSVWMAYRHLYRVSTPLDIAHVS